MEGKEDPMGTISSSASHVCQHYGRKLPLVQDAEFPELSESLAEPVVRQFDEEGEDHNHYQGHCHEEYGPDIDKEALSDLLPDTSTSSVPEEVLGEIVVANKDIHQREYEIVRQAFCNGMAKYTYSVENEAESVNSRNGKSNKNTESHCNSVEGYSQWNDEEQPKVKRSARPPKGGVENCELQGLIQVEEPVGHVVHGPPNVSPDSGIQSNSGSPFYPDSSVDHPQGHQEMDICIDPMAEGVVPMAYHDMCNGQTDNNEKPNCNVSEYVKLKQKHTRTKPVKPIEIVKAMVKEPKNFLMNENSKSGRARGRPKGSKNKTRHEFPVTSVEIQSVKQASPLQTATGTTATVQHLKHTAQHQMLVKTHPTTTVYTTVSTIYNSSGVTTSTRGDRLTTHTHGQSYGEAMHRKVLSQTNIRDTIDFRHIADHVTQKERRTDVISKKMRGRKKSLDRLSPLNMIANVPLNNNQPSSNANMLTVVNKSSDESEMNQLMSSVQYSIKQQLEEEKTTDFGLSADSIDSDIECIGKKSDKPAKSKNSMTTNTHIMMRSQKKCGRKKIPSTPDTPLLNVTSSTSSFTTSAISSIKPSPTVINSPCKQALFCRGGLMKLSTYASTPPTLAPVLQCSVAYTTANCIMDTASKSCLINRVVWV